MSDPIPTQSQLAHEYTGQQIDMFRMLLGGSAYIWASGGCSENPFGFPGYETGYFRNYRTYRWMLQNPIVRHARSNVIGPIIGSYFQYKAADDSVPESRVEMIEKMFDKIRQRRIADMLRGFDHGWAPFEPIWDNAGGKTQLVDLKPLLPERTAVLVDNNGRFTGLEQSVGNVPEIKAVSGSAEIPGLPAPYKAWIYTYDCECGNHYGRGWLENIRESAWKDWMDAYQQLQKIGAKLAGTQAIVKSPADQPGGAQYKTNSIDAVKAMSNGAPGAWLPSLAMNIDPKGQTDLWKLVIDLAKSSFISIEVLDFGSTVPAIEGLLARINKAEANIFSGALLSARTGLEGKHGTKAEAGVHTDTGMLVSELLHDDITAQIQPLIDAALVLNFGPDAAGSVTVDAPPLVDSKSQRFGDFLTAISTNQSVSAALAKYVDMEDVMDGLDIPVKEGAEFVIEPPPTPTSPFSNQPLDDNTNGNGKVHPRMAKLSKRMGRIIAGN